MSEPIWLSAADILALHALQIEENGGDPGMRDARRLESAAQRPRNLHAYGEPSLGEMAAAARLMKAIEAVTANPALHTGDLGGKARTVDVTRAICEALRAG